MRFDVVTIFPEYLEPMRASLLGKAAERGLVDVHVHDLRDWTHDVHRSVDDAPYGGGPGMQFRASVRDNARWGTPHSPALDTVAKTVRDWAFQRYGWHDTMMWERVGAER